MVCARFYLICKITLHCTLLFTQAQWLHPLVVIVVAWQTTPPPRLPEVRPWQSRHPLPTMSSGCSTTFHSPAPQTTHIPLPPLPLLLRLSCIPLAQMHMPHTAEMWVLEAPVLLVVLPVRVKGPRPLM